MYNWDYRPMAQDKAEDMRWILERRIVYGLNGARFRRREVQEHLPYLRVPDERRAFLMFLLMV